jgi:plastocyanin
LLGTPRLVAGVVVVAALAVPAAAGAATSTVYVGSPATLKGAPETTDATQFFPKKVKVNVGSKVKFEFRGFHNVYFPKGNKNAPFAIQDSTAISGVKDAAGADFWFNGQKRVIVDPLAAFPQGDGKIDKKGVDGSGLPQGDKPAPYVVTFKKTGTFTYYCMVHPLMKGKVTVQKRGRKADSKAKIKSAVAKQVAKTIKTAKKLANPSVPANTILAGSDNKDISLLQFFPGKLAIKAGQSVTFKMPPVTNEIHTATFGPEDYLKPFIGENFVLPVPAQNGPPTIVLQPQGVFPSEVPGTALSYTSSMHGNGFLNTGILDAEAHTIQPSSAQVSFPNPGTYHLVCAVHGSFMAADVTVNP